MILAAVGGLLIVGGLCWLTGYLAYYEGVTKGASIGIEVGKALAQAEILTRLNALVESAEKAQADISLAYSGKGGNA